MVRAPHGGEGKRRPPQVAMALQGHEVQESNEEFRQHPSSNAAVDSFCANYGRTSAATHSVSAVETAIGTRRQEVERFRAAADAVSGTYLRVRRSLRSASRPHAVRCAASACSRLLHCRQWVRERLRDWRPDPAEDKRSAACGRVMGLYYASGQQCGVSAGWSKSVLRGTDARSHGLRPPGIRPSRTSHDEPRHEPGAEPASFWTGAPRNTAIRHGLQPTSKLVLVLKIGIENTNFHACPVQR